MLIVESHSLDVFKNLAIEEYLMDEVQDRGPVLFLWRSACAVVIGKNQNPWGECRLDLMETDGVPLARRISGGGTVYHDKGNLNYCVITKREDYREQHAYDLIFDALGNLGIHAERSGKSNLSVKGLKFSGNAFAFRRGRALHHGTLLFTADLEQLGRYLGPMVKGIETHAIASVPAKVMNLGIGMTPMTEALKGAFGRHYGGSPLFEWTDLDLDQSVIEDLEEVKRSDAWLYGTTPRFSVPDGGSVLEVLKGYVVDGKNQGKSFRELAFSLVC